MATFTDKKIREAFEEASEQEWIENELDLLDTVMKELGLATWDERTMHHLLEKIRLIPEADAVIWSGQIRAGKKAVRQGHERLAQTVNDGS